MKIHRFIDNFDFSKTEIELSGELAHQIKKVLKLKIGEKIELSDGHGSKVEGEIIELGNTVAVRIGTVEKINLTKNKVILCCAILKKENFETVAEKATECGAMEIIPIITERTIKTGLNIERLKKITKEASEQSGRTDIPLISEPVSFKESIETDKNILNLFFDKSGEPLSKISASKNQKIKIWIGPEGGWTENEIKLAKDNNFVIFSLGSLTLRGETAAMIGTYLASNL